MQPPQIQRLLKSDASNQKSCTIGIRKKLSNKEILQRLKNPKTSWRSIAELVQVKNVNLVIPTAGIAAYGRAQLWQQALALFFKCFFQTSPYGLRLDAVAVSAAVSAVGSCWTLALWTLAGPGRAAAASAGGAVRGLTSAAVACGEHGEWPRALMLNQGQGSVQGLTASCSACEKPGRWSHALELCHQAMICRVEVDQVAVNGILNVCAGVRQWQRCVEIANGMTNNKEAVMTNILSKACAGPWAWPKGVAALQDAQHAGASGSLLAGTSAVMQSVAEWSTAAECLKNLRQNALQVDAMACCSLLKTLECAGHWPGALQSLRQNDQQQIALDAALYNTLVSAGEKSSEWEATLLLFSLRSDHGGLDANSVSASVLSCCQTARWPAALALLCSLERSSVPPSSHALAALLSVAKKIPQLEVMAFSMLAHATVDGVSPPVSLMHQLQSMLLAAAAYRHPQVTLPPWRHGTNRTPTRQGLYRYSKELRLLRHVLTSAGPPGSQSGHRVCQAIESFGTAVGGQRWLKVAGTQKAKVLEAVVAGIGGHQHCEILEIGTYCGYSALRMLLSLKRPEDLQIHSLEADPIHAAVACNVLQAAGVTADEIQIHIGHSKSLLPKWPATTQFRAVFMDQRGSRYDEDLNVLEHRRLLACGAAIIADNVLKPGAPRFLWKLWPRHQSDTSLDDDYHVQVLSLEEFAMPSEDWMTVSLAKMGRPRDPWREGMATVEVPEKIAELHHLAEAMRDLASKPGGSSVSFEEWRNFAAKMKEELKTLGIQATSQLDW